MSVLWWRRIKFLLSCQTCKMCLWCRLFLSSQFVWVRRERNKLRCRHQFKEKIFLIHSMESSREARGELSHLKREMNNQTWILNHIQAVSHTGGHPSWLPPIKWRCKWYTDWQPCLPSLMTTRKPLWSKPRSRHSLRPTTIKWPSNCSSSSSAFDSWTMGLRGITRKCTLATGLMSLNATHWPGERERKSKRLQHGSR